MKILIVNFFLIFMYLPVNAEMMYSAEVVADSLNISRPSDKDISWMTQEHKQICEWAWRVKPIS